MMWETYRKRGRHWEYLGLREAMNDVVAAHKTSYAHNIKVIGIRPEDSRDKIRVFRFKHVSGQTRTIRGNHAS